MPSGSEPEADERTTWGWGRRGGGQGGCSLVQLATAVPVDLRGGDCEAPRNHQLAKLAADARSMSGPIHTSCFTLTVRAGAVHQVQEFLAINAC